MGPIDFELRYVPLDPSTVGDEAAVDSILRQTYFSDARITFRRVDRITPSASGKYIEYINEYERARGLNRHL